MVRNRQSRPSVPGGKSSRKSPRTANYRRRSASAYMHRYVPRWVTELLPHMRVLLRRLGHLSGLSSLIATIHSRTRQWRLAGLLASIGMGVLGALIGGLAVYVSQQDSDASASIGDYTPRGPAKVQAHISIPSPALRDPQLHTPTITSDRAAYVSTILRQDPSNLGIEPSIPDTPREIASAPVQGTASKAIPTSKPHIIVIFDDMGIDDDAFDEVMELPGPLTFSFLPYGKDLTAKAELAAQKGNAIMLHLPMAPVGTEDPGPNSLHPDMDVMTLLETMDHNLDQLSGYTGVNNHMGSAFTADLDKMTAVLSVLKDRGLFYIDSLTTPDSKAHQAGEAIDAEVFVRDIFIDPDLDRKTVFNQLKRAETIARKTGYAVAIAHPRAATIDVIGPWLTTAPARGFRLSTVAELAALKQNWQAKQQQLAQR